jgi:putative transposase
MARFEIPEGWSVQAGPGTSVTITPLLTSRATSRPLRVIAPSAQSGPPSSAEPTLRPGPARPAATKRGREPATRLAPDPETGCRRDEHYRSLISNGVRAVLRLAHGHIIGRWDAAVIGCGNPPGIKQFWMYHKGPAALRIC